jgi:uncharacterized protein YbjQ (UPF0145 family)
VIGVTFVYAPLVTGTASIMLVATGTAVELGPPALR